MSTTRLRPNPLSRNLRMCMAERRMNQQDLANRLEVSLRSVSSWCRGEHEPHIRTAEKLARIFGRSAQWFYEEHGN